jgi:hypothetical protein
MRSRIAPRSVGRRSGPAARVLDPSRVWADGGPYQSSRERSNMNAARVWGGLILSRSSRRRRWRTSGTSRATPRSSHAVQASAAVDAGIPPEQDLPIFAPAISRFASLFDVLARGFLFEPSLRPARPRGVGSRGSGRLARTAGQPLGRPGSARGNPAVGAGRGGGGLLEWSQRASARGRCTASVGASPRYTPSRAADLRPAAGQLPEPSAPLDQQAAAVDAQHAALDPVAAAGRRCPSGTACDLMTRP